MIRNFIARRRAKKFLKLIGAHDLKTISPESQAYWAMICARAAWKSFNSDFMVVPVLIEDDLMAQVLAQDELALMCPSNGLRFVPNPEHEAYHLSFNTVDPQELLADPQVQQVLAKSYDLLEEVEENVWELPPSVTSKAHKLRTAIQRQVQASLGGTG